MPVYFQRQTTIEMLIVIDLTIIIDTCRNTDVIQIILAPHTLSIVSASVQAVYNKIAALFIPILQHT
jgi:hypothetical protein